MITRSIDHLINFVIDQAEGVRKKARKWTPTEEAFLKANLGRMTEVKIAKTLGRSKIAVHLHWKRDMQLPSPSKAPDVLTAHQAARMLGIDGHKVCHWIDQGFIPGREMAGGRKIRLIERKAFTEWVLDHDHWMYFDFARVKDQTLKRLLDEEAKRWGDEWWDTPRVAKHHKVHVGDVKRYIQHGRIKATQIKYSLGGRHPQRRWSLWFMLKSEATRKDMKFVVRRYKK